MARRATACTVLALLGGGWGAALGQEAPRDGLGFGILPVGPDATRGYFFFRDVDPGTALTAAVSVSNVSGQDKVVVLRAQDTTTSGTGGLSYGPVEDGPGAWLSPRDRRVSVPAGETVDVTYRVDVPADARPGDHFAGIVAYDQEDLEALEDEPESEQAVQLKFVSRLAIPFRVRVPGDLLAEVALRDVKLEITPSGSSVDVIFANTGNVLIPSSEGRVNISQEGVVLATKKIALTSFTPGSQITVSVPFEGAPARATYRAKGFLQPLYAPVVNFDESVVFGGDESKELQRETGLTPIGADDGSGIPAWVWGLAAGALVLALVLLFRRRRGGRASTLDRSSPRVPVQADAAHVAALDAIDLNTATAEELVSLPGVGPAAARRIVEHRSEYGDFRSVDDLSKVEGFTAERIDELRGHATAGRS